MEEGSDQEMSQLGSAVPQNLPAGPLLPSKHLAGEGGAEKVGGLLSASASPTGSRKVMVPTNSEMELMLANAEDGDSLADLANATAALVEIARRQDLMKQQLFEIAEWHLRVKRKLGVLLTQTESRGGDRAKCHADTLLNGGRPGSLSSGAAKRCRRLAEIDEAVFSQYLEGLRSSLTPPSDAGAVRFANPGVAPAAARPSSKRKSSGGCVEVTPGVLDAIRRCLGDIDVCIGEAKVACRRRYTFSTWAEKNVSGIVLISAAVDPADWLPRAVDWTQRAKCDQVVVLLPAELNAGSLRILAGASWQLCFLSNPGASGVVAYIGARREAFFASMHEHGLVVSVYQ